jgi:hypothetical protein
VSALPLDWSTEDIARGLRGWTATTDSHVRAAVELLIEHDFWLRRSDFRTACVQHDVDEDGDEDDALTIRWHDAAAFLESGPRGSSGELTILRFAVVLGSNELQLTGLGSWGRGAVVRAVAAGLVPHADMKRVPLQY